MADLLATGAAWLADQLQRHAAGIVTYQHGGLSLEVPATIGKTEFLLDDGSGTVVRFHSRDFLIRAAALQVAGVPFLPTPGDRIAETRDGRTYVYEVLAPGTEPAFRYSDPFRQLLRVHTKHVATT